MRITEMVEEIEKIEKSKRKGIKKKKTKITVLTVEKDHSIYRDKNIYGGRHTHQEITTIQMKLPKFLRKE